MAARRKSRAFTVYNVHGLDVWGNAREGFWVNDVYPSQGKVTIYDGATDKEIVQSLKREGFIDPKIRFSSVRIDGEPGYDLYIEETRTGRGVYELRPVSTRTGEHRPAR